MNNTSDSEICLFCCKTSATILHSENKNLAVNNLVSRFVLAMEQFTNRKFTPPHDDNNSDSCYVSQLKLTGCCKVCQPVLDSFCADYHKIKCLELKMACTLERLHDIMNLAGKVPSRWVKLKDMFHQNSEHITGSIGEPGNLTDFRTNRTKIINQCKKCISKSQPRVQLKRISHNYNKLPVQYIVQIKRLPNQEIRDEEDELPASDPFYDDATTENCGQMDNNPSLIKCENEIPVELDTDGGQSFTEDDQFQEPRDIEIKFENSSVDFDTIEGNDFPVTSTEYALRKKKKVSYRLTEENEQETEWDGEDADEKSSNGGNDYQKFSEDEEYTDEESGSSEDGIEDFKEIKVKQIKSKTENCDAVCVSLECKVHRRKIKSKKKTDSKNTVKMKSGSHPCASCEKTFSTRISMMRHKRRVHQAKSHKCYICHKTFRSVDNLKKHEFVHMDPQTWKFKCDICDKPFYQDCFLQNHIKIHHNSTKKPRKPHKNDNRYDKSNCKNMACKFCGIWFPSLPDLGLHVKQSHGDKVKPEYICKPYKCNDCNTRFPSRGRLQTHISRVHVTVRKYECSKCDKTFKTSTHLRLHEMIHEGESAKRFQCIDCGNKYYTNSDLRKHIRIHAKAKK